MASTYSLVERWERDESGFVCLSDRDGHVEVACSTCVDDTVATYILVDTALVVASTSLLLPDLRGKCRRYRDNRGLAASKAKFMDSIPL